MNFHESEDRIQAVKWYVDSIRERFCAKNYRHIGLGGFYRVPRRPRPRPRFSNRSAIT